MISQTHAHKISVPGDPPSAGVAHRRPCFEYGPCGFSLTRVALRKLCGNSLLAWGVADKPSLNFFILIRNWHRVLITQWKILLSCVKRMHGIQRRRPFPLRLARVGTAWTWELRPVLILWGCRSSGLLCSPGPKEPGKAARTQDHPDSPEEKWKQHWFLVPAMPGRSACGPSEPFQTAEACPYSHSGCPAERFGVSSTCLVYHGCFPNAKVPHRIVRQGQARNGQSHFF